MNMNEIQQGIDAYWRGESLSDNPFPREDRRRKSWQAGWYQGDDDYKGDRDRDRRLES